MRELMVSEAPQPRVSTLVKGAVEDEGGVVRQHTHQATHFDHLRTAADNWSRSGYVGTYQPFRAPYVQVRCRVWASWPRRLFLTFVFLGLAEAVVFFLMSLAAVPPPPNVWIITAIVTIAGIALSLLTYATSWSGSAEVEESLMRNIGTRLRSEDDIPGDVYSKGGWEEHRKDLVEQAVEQAPKAETTSSGGMLSVMRRDRGDEEPSGKKGLRGRFKRDKADDDGDDALADGDESTDTTTVDEHDEEPTGKKGLLGRFKRDKTGDAEGGDEEEEPPEKKGLLGRLRRGQATDDEKE